MSRLSEEDWSVIAAAVDHATKGDFRQALEAFSSIESHTTDHRELATILLNEAQCDRMLRNFEAAHTACDRALDLSKDNEEDTVDAWIVKAAILVDERRIGDALNVIAGSLERYPSINQSLQLLKKGELLASHGEHAKAIPILNRLLQAHDLDESEIATIHYTLGVSYGVLGKFENAAEHLDKAQSLSLPAEYLSNNSFWLANVAAKRRDFRGAKSHLLNALAQAEHSDVDLLTDIYESLANISRELKDDLDAAKYGNLWQASTHRH